MLLALEYWGAAQVSPGKGCLNEFSMTMGRLADVGQPTRRIEVKRRVLGLSGGLS